MAEQNEPQGTDAEYQPRTRRERRELEKRSRKAVRAQNSENAADATGAPSGMLPLNSPLKRTPRSPSRIQNLSSRPLRLRKNRKNL